MIWGVLVQFLQGFIYFKICLTRAIYAPSSQSFFFFFSLYLGVLGKEGLEQAILFHENVDQGFFSPKYFFSSIFLVHSTYVMQIFPIRRQNIFSTYWK